MCIDAASPEPYRLPAANLNEGRFIEEYRLLWLLGRLHRQGDGKLARFFEPVKAREHTECRTNWILVFVEVVRRIKAKPQRERAV